MLFKIHVFITSKIYWVCTSTCVATSKARLHCLFQFNSSTWLLLVLTVEKDHPGALIQKKMTLTKDQKCLHYQKHNRHITARMLILGVTPSPLWGNDSICIYLFSQLAVTVPGTDSSLGWFWLLCSTLDILMQRIQRLGSLFYHFSLMYRACH